MTYVIKLLDGAKREVISRLFMYEDGRKDIVREHRGITTVSRYDQNGNFRGSLIYGRPEPK